MWLRSVVAVTGSNSIPSLVTSYAAGAGIKRKKKEKIKHLYLTKWDKVRVPTENRETKQGTFMSKPIFPTGFGTLCCVWLYRWRSEFHLEGQAVCAI